MAFTAGGKIRAADLNRLGQVVARNQRTTNSASYTTAARILSVRAPVVAGRSYRVQFHGEEFAIGGAAVGQTELRHTTNDVEPVVTSPVLARGLVHHINDGVPDLVAITGLFHAATTGFLRVVVVGTRVVGTPPCSMAADPSFPAILVVEDVGDTVATTGTVY